jgi:hypothetical protein
MAAFPANILANGYLAAEITSSPRKQLCLPWRLCQFLCSGRFPYANAYGILQNFASFADEKVRTPSSVRVVPNVTSASLYSVTTVPVRDSSQWLHFFMYPYKRQLPNSANAKIISNNSRKIVLRCAYSLAEKQYKKFFKRWIFCHGIQVSILWYLELLHECKKARCYTQYITESTN